jgi:hypothetical protein
MTKTELYYSPIFTDEFFTKCFVHNVTFNALLTKNSQMVTFGNLTVMEFWLRFYSLNAIFIMHLLTLSPIKCQVRSKIPAIKTVKCWVVNLHKLQGQ